MEHKRRRISAKGEFTFVAFLIPAKGTETLSRLRVLSYRKNTSQHQATPNNGRQLALDMEYRRWFGHNNARRGTLTGLGVEEDLTDD